MPNQMNKSIKFHEQMVRSILSGNKTQFRKFLTGRLQYSVKGIIPYVNRQGNKVFGHLLGESKKYGNILELSNIHCPYGKVGDRLWVKEMWCGDPPIYKVDMREVRNSLEWKSANRMTKWTSRLTLEITDISVERLFDINNEDAVAEGMTPQLLNYLGYSSEDHIETFNVTQARKTFRLFWQFENGVDSWMNSWVWKINFKRILND